MRSHIGMGDFGLKMRYLIKFHGHSSLQYSQTVGGYVVMSSDAISTSGVKVGNTVTLSGANGSFEYTVIGSFKSRADDVAAVLSSAYAVSDFASASYGFFAYKAGDPESVITQIRDMLGDKQHWSRTVEVSTESEAKLS